MRGNGNVHTVGVEKISLTGLIFEYFLKNNYALFFQKKTTNTRIIIFTIWKKFKIGAGDVIKVIFSKKLLKSSHELKIHVFWR